MNHGVLQHWLDQLALTSRQRWGLIALSLLSILAASAVAMVVGGQLQLAVAASIAFVTVVATLRTDSHTAAAAEALVLWQWFISADDVTTPWSIAVAACVLVFHATMALMAVTPISATVDRAVCRAWLARGVVLMATTLAVWLLVLALDRPSDSGSVPLTMAALMTLSVLVLAARRRLTGLYPIEVD